MRDSLKQWARVQRALIRIENNKNRQEEEYEDDVWFFFQNCYHLKDWIIHDDTNPISSKTVEADIERNLELKLCADLANRSKHLKLTKKPRKDAKISSKDLTIDCATAGFPGEGRWHYDFVVSWEDSSMEAIKLAQESVKEWAKLLTTYGVLN